MDHMRLGVFVFVILFFGRIKKKKKICFVGAAKQSGRLLKSDYVFKMATEWNERERDEIWEGDGGWGGWWAPAYKL